MFNNQNELSKAVVLYLGYGYSLSPVADAEKIIEVYGKQMGYKLIADVLKLIDEVNCIEIVWSNIDLENAGKMVRTEIHNRHQFLVDQALDALAWKFTFDWR